MLEASMVCIAQKADSSTQLMRFNPLLKMQESLLWSAYTPSSVDLNPNKKSICFLDNDRIRIQAFSKRSACSLALSMPLYDIRFVRWLDEYNLYCVARTNKRYGVFIINQEGTVFPFLFSESEGMQYLDAICNANTMFAIAHYAGQYAVVEARYDAHFQVTQLMKIYESPEAVLFFIRAESNMQLLLIAQSKVKNTDKTITFDCFSLTNTFDQWVKAFLFSFSVPIALVCGNGISRLFESVHPLIPRFFNDCYYYASCTDSSKWLNIRRYSMAHKTIEQLTDTQAYHCFAPLINDREIWYGLSKSNCIVKLAI